MFLLVTPSGGKLWRLKYRRPGRGKENLLSLGAFPDVPLKRAREKRDEARALLADGIDPARSGRLRLSLAWKLSRLSRASGTRNTNRAGARIMPRTPSTA